MNELIRQDILAEWTRNLADESLADRRLAHIELNQAEMAFIIDGLAEIFTPEFISKISPDVVRMIYLGALRYNMHFQVVIQGLLNQQFLPDAAQLFERIVNDQCSYAPRNTTLH